MSFIPDAPVAKKKSSFVPDEGTYRNDLTSDQYWTGTAKNILPSAVRTIGGVVSGVAGMFNPDTDKNTLYGMSRLAQGALQKLDPTENEAIANTIGDAMPLIGITRRVDKTLGRSTDYQPQAEAVGNFYKDRYGGVENIKKSFYEDPTGVALDVSTVATGVGGALKGAGAMANSSKLARAGQIASKIGEVTDPLSIVGKVGGKLVNKVVPNLSLESKLGEFGKQVEQAGKDYALRGLRPSQSMITKFKKITGMNLEDYIKKNNLYGNDIAMASENVSRFQEPFDSKTLRTDVDVPITDILDGYDKRINNLAKSGIDDPVAMAQANKLRQQRQSIVDGYYQKKPTGTGSYAIKPKVKSRTLKDIVETRRGIDKNTPKGDFGQSIVEAGSQRKIGDIYRELQYKYGGKAVEKLGKELQKAYEFKNIVENAPKGKGNLPLGLNKGIWGVAFNNPIIGAVAEAVVNSPRTIGSVSQGAQAFGKMLQSTKLKGLSTTSRNIFRDLIESGKVTRMTNPK